ncbi:hypothetical protein B0H34DRAFT_709146 [Crassisporium funariophilum]|nr:hypothetical protein B0H34DRAFT_709146 [Crassisporium funariophilum]
MPRQPTTPKSVPRAKASKPATPKARAPASGPPDISPYTARIFHEAAQESVQWDHDLINVPEAQVSQHFAYQESIDDLLAPQVIQGIILPPISRERPSTYSQQLRSITMESLVDRNTGSIRPDRSHLPSRPAPSSIKPRDDSPYGLPPGMRMGTYGQVWSEHHNQYVAEGPRRALPAPMQAAQAPNPFVDPAVFVVPSPVKRGKKVAFNPQEMPASASSNPPRTPRKNRN